MSAFQIDAGSMGTAGARLPRLVPATLLGRLAVDRRFQGRGFGAELLAHALRRAVSASEEVASAAVVVDAIDERAVAFYARQGFRPLVDPPRRLFLPMGAVRESVGSLHPLT